MPDKIVKQHYIALAKLLKIYRTAPFDKNLINASLNFCKSLYKTAKAHPDLIFAQPQLYKPQLPFIVNLTFNSTLLTCLLSVRNKFDPSVTIQLMCGSLSIYALEQLSIEKHYQTDDNDQKTVAKKIGLRNAKFSHLLETNQQQIWLCTYLLCSHVHLPHYPRNKLTTPVTALAYMANKLALLCIPNTLKHPISLAHAIKHLSLKCCSKWYELLTPLLKYPSLLPVGSYVRLRDGSIHIVLSLRTDGLVTQPLPVKQSVEVKSDKMAIQLTLVEQVVHIYPCQHLNSFTRINQWWGTDLIEWLSNNVNYEQRVAFDSVLPIQTAPPSLLIIQDQLNHINADITVIAKAIEKEPTFAQQLQVSASISNRQKQPVLNIQQGLAMLGFERTNSILLQHALLSRLNQQYFPVQQALLTFSQFFVFIVGELATRTKLISPELARTTAYFVVSRLFTLPKIRSLNHWETSTQSTFRVECLIKIKENNSLKNDGFLLANAWQQNKQMLEVLQQYDLVTQNQENKPAVRQFCFLLGISLTLAHEHYFTETTRCNETADYFNTGLIELGFSQAEVIKIMTDITSSTNVFCPLG
jgi:HD-like signal output (HDOD) protein